MTAERRYRAFISYSHSDRKWAMWLLRSLETWRVPSRLVGQTTARGEIPARLSPLFADREELSATDNLRASLVSALAHSDALIVICSPAAAQSLWVEQEILRYRELHPDGLILALIVAGDPAAISADQQCFPRALLCQQHPDGSWTAPVYEPVAADARPQADGRYRAKLKLIAGLLAVDLDNLVAREQQRQQRKWIAMAAASLVGMAVMTTLTVFAYRARNEAEHRHAQAEGLIEFMLTDLRQKLEPVGRLDALQVVGEKAMTYYSDEAPDNMQADALGRRQRVMHLLGEIQELRGNLDDAFTLFEQAAKVTAELLARDPTNTKRMFDHAQSEFWVGYLAWRQQNLDAATVRFERYKDLMAKLVSSSPTNDSWLLELSAAQVNLGVVNIDRMEHDEAIVNFLAAVQIREKLQINSPDDINIGMELGTSYAWLADAMLLAWRFDEAKLYRNRELSLYSGILQKEDKNTLILRNLHVCLRKLSELEFATASGNHLRSIDDSIKIIRKLTTLEPNNTLWMEMLAKTLIQMSAQDLSGKKPSNSEEMLSSAQHILTKLLKTNDSIESWKEHILQVRYWTAYSLTRASKKNEAKTMVIELLEAIEKAPTPHSSYIVETKASTLALLAELDEEKAAEHWREILAILPKNAKLSAPLQAKACMAALHAASSLASSYCIPLMNAGYRHPEFTALMGGALWQQHLKTG